MSEKSRQPEKEQINLQDRLLTAVLAPIVFNISILMSHLYPIRTKAVGNLFVNGSRGFGFLFFVLAILLPAMLGFFLGTSRFATLLGHFFYTNDGHEKNAEKTIVAWLSFFVIAYLFRKLL